MVNRSRQPTPPYLRVAGEIRDKIRDGELRPGDQVPSMAKIAEQWSVSRGTARRVLQQLQEWGLIEIQPGWGSFVRSDITLPMTPEPPGPATDTSR